MPNVFTNTNTFSPLGNALSSRINGPSPMGFPSSTPAMKKPAPKKPGLGQYFNSKDQTQTAKPSLLSRVTDFWNNPQSGPGRAFNPKSPDYVGDWPGLNGPPRDTGTPAPTAPTTRLATSGNTTTPPVASAYSATRPTPQTTPPASPISAPNFPQNNPSPVAGGSNPPTTPPANATTQPPAGGLYGEIVRNLMNVGSGNVTGNIKQINDLTKSYGDQVSGIQSSGVPLAFGQGQERVIGDQYTNRLNAAQTGLASATALRGQELGALGTAAGLAAPVGAAPGTSYFNPVEGNFRNQFIGENGGSGGGTVDDIVSRIGRGTQGYDQGIQSARSLGIPENVIQSRLQQMFPGFNQTASNQNVQSGAGRQSAYNQGLVNLRAGDNILNSILGTFGSNADLNRTPITAFTNIRQFLAGQTSDPAQQQLSAQVAQYINTLGLDPSLVQSLAGQERGTLWDLLQTLRQTAQSQNEANLAAGFGNTGGAGGGGNNDPLGIR